MMNALILDKRPEGENRCCYLAQITLEDYVTALPSAYQDYDVQREIVSNVYLDSLVDTVLHKKHIPPIVLVVDEDEVTKSGRTLKIRSFKILDGLQRTYRLKSIRDTLHFCLNEIEGDPATFLSWTRFKFSRQFSAPLRELNSNTDVLRAILWGLENFGETRLLETFSDNTQWFEIWTGMSPDEEVRKMLTLNAGHKPVKTRHQLELLFLNLLPILRKDEGRNFRLVREKEVGSAQFSKGRDCGSFHFAHIITGLLSFFTNEPVAPSTDLIQNIQTNEDLVEEYNELMNPEFIKKFIHFLVSMDKIISDQYGQLGLMWMGREVTLAGLCGSLGCFASESKASKEAVMDKMLLTIRRDVSLLKLDSFEKVRNSVELSKVNIGNVNRTAIFEGITSFINGSASRKSGVDWRKHFGVGPK